MKKYLPYGTSNKKLALLALTGPLAAAIILLASWNNINSSIVLLAIITGIIISAGEIALNSPSSEKQARFFMTENQLKINRVNNLTILKNHEGVMFNFYGKQVEILKNPNLKPLKTGEPIKLGRAEGYALTPNTKTDSSLKAKNFTAKVQANNETWVMTMIGAGWREEDRTDWAGLLQEIEINK